MRSASQLLQSGRCGFCRARACDGDVEIVPVATPVNKHPGLILEADGELHPRSQRKGGGAGAAPKLTVVLSAAVPEKSAKAALVAFVRKALVGGGLLACAVVAIAAVYLLANAAYVVGAAAGKAYSHATSASARELTYDFGNPLEREAYCDGRAYLINVRGANVPEDVRELRRNVMKQCPELAAQR